MCSSALESLDPQRLRLKPKMGGLNKRKEALLLGTAGRQLRKIINPGGSIGSNTNGRQVCPGKVSVLSARSSRRGWRLSAHHNPGRDRLNTLLIAPRNFLMETGTTMTSLGSECCEQEVIHGNAQHRLGTALISLL